MKSVVRILMLSALSSIFSISVAGENKNVLSDSVQWPQWRGPNRDGVVGGPKWPERLEKDSLTRLWRVELGPSYSTPIVIEDRVFTTETKNKESEVVTALDRKTGKELWRAEWKGAMSVPFFAAANGSWIRSTPAYDGECLYVAGICDVLVCLDGKTGSERWRVDFVKQFSAPLPAFGCVCSPLVDGDALYFQAGASVFKLNKKTGEILWRALKDEGGMNGSAFSSPILADLAGQRQLIVQTRDKLAGIDPGSGNVLWIQKVPNFRGMNILTPVVFGDAVFTSSYMNMAWLYKVAKTGDSFTVTEEWSNTAKGYMCSPVVVDGHAYLHLQSQRFACIELKTGTITWTAGQSLGKYCSLVAQGDRILALDQRGRLILFKANPKAYELIDTLEISDSETWAHLAVSGDQVFIRELKALSVYRWNDVKKP
ncbi:MAG: PQQ-binding-like beta-propeller repeat protein [Planctomycetota bacterium]